MLPTPVEIKGKLLKALEDKNDVDESVLEMVSILERYPITRATLEETKIGKMVNDLRRKIKNEKLAKRVKQLVRNWKKLLDETASVNGSPRPVHPAITQLRSSPNVSPALTGIPGTGRLVSPAQAPGKPSTPKLVAQKCASPALPSSRYSAPLGRKDLSPAMGLNRPCTPTLLNLQRVPSPDLLRDHPKSAALSSATGRVASPVTGHVASSPVSGRVISPAVSRQIASSESSHAVSKVMSNRASSPALSGRVASPGVSTALRREKSQIRPRDTTSSGHSPALQTCGADVSGQKEQCGLATDGHGYKDRVASTCDTFCHDDKHIPSPSCSESNQDRVGREINKDQYDSDDEVSFSSSKTGQSHYTYPHSHSTKVSVNSKNYIKDQRELSKTNVANRKRTREMSNSPTPETYKKARLETSSLSADSLGHDKIINGYTPKSSKKHVPGSEVAGIHSSASMPSLHRPVSSPQMSRVFIEDSASLSYLDSFMRQESSESRLSTQSFDRPLRDKHKVKTTEQLIEELQKKNKSSKVGDSIMTKLRTNQIEKEADVPESVLPAGMKPRGKRGRPRKNDVNVTVPSSDVKLSQVKSELVERFLNTSDPSSPLDEYSPFKDDPLSDPVQSTFEPTLELGACSSPCARENFDTFSASRQDRSESAPKDESSTDAISPPLPSAIQSERSGSALTLEEIYAQLPPVDYDIDWDAVDFFELPERKPVTEETVDSLHNEKLPGINGLYDVRGRWSTWQQTVTLPSYEGNQLHILPYVDLDN